MTTSTTVAENVGRREVSARTVVSIRGIAKSFGATLAVDHVDLDLRSGEVHALVGENGAGKSTLMRVLAGFHSGYSGTIVVEGEQTQILHPRQARALGIALVHQELSLLPAGTAFDGDKGVVFSSSDDGRSWSAMDLGVTPKSTIFVFAIDAQQPEHLYCASNGGEFFWSRDRGNSWTANPLPAGATRVYSLAVGP